MGNVRSVNPKRLLVVGSAFAVFAALAVAPRPSSGQSDDTNSTPTDPALANRNRLGANGQTMQQNQAYAQGYNKAYNQAYGQKQQALDQGSGQQSGGGCCGGGSGGG